MRQRARRPGCSTHPIRSPITDNGDGYQDCATDNPCELYDMDGSQASGGNPQYIAGVDGKLYFQADDGTDAELWVYDPSAPVSDGGDGHTDGNNSCATGDNPCELADIVDGAGNSSPREFTGLDGKLYFTASIGSDRELWVYDPSAAVVDGGSAGFLDCATDNPCRVAEIWDSGSASPDQLATLNGKLYFRAIDGTDQELWVYDPSSPVADTGGAYQDCATDNPCELADLRVGGSSFPDWLTVLDGKLYFRAYDAGNDQEMWVYDPSSPVDNTGGYQDCATDNPCELVDINGISDSSPTGFTPLGGKLYFNANDGTDYELWVYDPSVPVNNGGDDYAHSQNSCATDNPCKVVDLRAVGSSFPNWITALGGKLYFQASDETDFGELWVYDPNAPISNGGDGYAHSQNGCATDNPCELDDINDSGNASIIEPIALDGTLYFQAYEPIGGTELWAFDATKIFADGFESGDLTAWSDTKGAVVDGDYGDEGKCKLCVTTTGPLHGDNSLKVRVPNNKPHFLIDTSSDSAAMYHARFSIKLGKTLKMDNKNKIKLFQARKDGSKKKPFLVEFRKYGTKYQIRAILKTDGKKTFRTKWKRLPKKSAVVDVNWSAATSNGAKDGTFTLWVNGKQKANKTALNNDSFVIDHVKLGVTGKLKLRYNISGSFKLDAFSSDDYMIGPLK